MRPMLTVASSLASERIPEKPSLLRRVAQLLCSHDAWSGLTIQDDTGTPQMTCRRCLTCGYMTWEEHAENPR